MSNRRFYTQLTLLTTGLLLFMAILHGFTSLAPYWDLTLWSIGLFVVISLSVFHFGKILAPAPNKNHYTSLILGAIFIKMVLSILLLLVYSRLTHPDSRLFIVPFLIVYLAFTIFETVVLTRLGRLRAPEN
ncbi:MAG: hypothetical protein D6714_09985 [Bacteroidetes bacterium]|nr:MAG: hypothetical protein D6714_09985 [Bacteroidota bacterium]